MKHHTHNCGELRKKDIGTHVKIAGWVDSIRHHGKVSFINLRDRYGITQIVVKDEPLLHQIREIGHEWIIEVSGKVSERPPGMANPNLPTGEIDVEAYKIDVISRSKVPPFVVADDVKAKEETRLRYRFLDLRRYTMQEALIFKSQLYQTIREFLHKQGFVNIETPILGKSTPEGARDFLVPSRFQPGKFYSLTQSPQIYKQLLIIAGFDKYYQLAKCLRDEDQRKDRQLEHTQLDLELAFADEEIIFKLMENLMKYIFRKLLAVNIHTPFKRITYKTALQKYGTDKPDIRYELTLKDVTETAKKTSFQKFKENEKVKCIIFEKELSTREIDELEILVKGYGTQLFWLKYKSAEPVIDTAEMSSKGNFYGPICKYFTPQVLKEFVNFVGAGGKPATTTVLFVAGDEKRASLALGGVRNSIIEKYLSKQGDYEFVWITDFPIFERDENTNELVPSHHVFVMPKDTKQLENNPESVIGRLYDLVLNGVELGSGSVRVHSRNLQEKIMEIIGFDKQRRERNFGCLLEALEYGAPPHAGIALGLDRLATTMLNKKSIQDVIAFPKTLTGIGLLEGIPSEVEPAQLDEVHIKVKK